jgi:hypothetical protein
MFPAKVIKTGLGERVGGKFKFNTRADAISAIADGYRAVKGIEAFLVGK